MNRSKEAEALMEDLRTWMQTTGTSAAALARQLRLPRQRLSAWLSAKALPEIDSFMLLRRFLKKEKPEIGEVPAQTPAPGEDLNISFFD
jgi:hypothetical protein